MHDETLIDLDVEPSVGVAGEALAAWADADTWADEPIEFADEVAEAGEPPDVHAPTPESPRAPLRVTPAPPRHEPVDEPVDLAALVVETDAGAQGEADAERHTDRDGDGDPDAAAGADSGEGRS